MSEPWVFIMIAWAVVAVAFVALWVWCERIDNAGYIDVAWAFSIGVAVIVAAMVLDTDTDTDTDTARSALVAGIGGVWALRLAWHLFKRIHGHEEDGRYAHMREAFGRRASLAFFVFFQMQAVFVVLFLAPMVAALTRQGALDWRDGLGLAVWLVALTGEWVADKQLNDFKRDPANKGRVCKQGLWRYSRHPNYFFEWVHWFAYLIIGARLSESIGYAALAGPVVMGVFLIFVTGVPYTEKRAIASKGEAYRQYQRETSAFVPWFVKRVR